MMPIMLKSDEFELSVPALTHAAAHTAGLMPPPEQRHLKGRQLVRCVQMP
jgi:hypothetical protein